MKKTIEKENYLKTLYKMGENSQAITVTSLAKHFSVSKSTVSNMIKKLVLMNLVDSKPYQPIFLTNSGKKIAIKIISKHRLIELYLFKKMQFDLNEVHEIAEEIEHINSPIFFSKVRKMLKQDTIDPHGSNIPKTDF